MIRALPFILVMIGAFITGLALLMKKAELGLKDFRRPKAFNPDPSSCDYGICKAYGHLERHHGEKGPMPLRSLIIPATPLAELEHDAFTESTIKSMQEAGMLKHPESCVHCYPVSPRESVSHPDHKEALEVAKKALLEEQLKGILSVPNAIVGDDEQIDIIDGAGNVIHVLGRGHQQAAYKHTVDSLCHCCGETTTNHQKWSHNKCDSHDLAW